MEEQATLSGDSMKGRRTMTSSGVRLSLDAGAVGRMSDAAVTGIDDDIGWKVGVLGGEISEERGMRSDAVVLGKQAKSMIINRSSNM